MILQRHHGLHNTFLSRIQHRPAFSRVRDTIPATCTSSYKFTHLPINLRHLSNFLDCLELRQGEAACLSFSIWEFKHAAYSLQGRLTCPKMRPGRDTAFDAAYSTKMTPPMNYGIRIVPERTAFIIERFGKFNRVLDSGIHLLIPLVCPLHSITCAQNPQAIIQHLA